MPDRRFEVAVVGGGPAGLAAALTAYTATRSVVMIDEGIAAGGQIWRRESTGARDPRSLKWIEMLEGSEITRVAGATVVDARARTEGHELIVERDGVMTRVVASRIILATGARELFLPFPGWTLPGVLGVGGAQAMAKGGMNVRGKRVVIAGTGPLLLAVAASLAKRGASIIAVVEQVPMTRMAMFAARLWRMPAVAREAIRYGWAAGPLALRFGSWVREAKGGGRLETALVTDGRRETSIACDFLCTGYGLTPNAELGRLLGCDLRGGAIQVDAWQQTSVPGVFAAGECCGIGGVDAAFMEGIAAGYAAVGDHTVKTAFAARDVLRAWGKTLDVTFALRPEVLALATNDTIVCRCEDVRHGDIDPAWTARQAKLYARVGMGPCQGRVCGPAMQAIHGWTSDRVRAPISPSFLSTLVAAPDPASRA
jgi:NADPH-dependent 2,4-dienoyl-CoA reductase/sulfur reductase-like enzyme